MITLDLLLKKKKKKITSNFLRTIFDKSDNSIFTSD